MGVILNIVSNGLMVYILPVGVDSNGVKSTIIGDAVLIRKLSNIGLITSFKVDSTDGEGEIEGHGYINMPKRYTSR